MVNDFFVIEKPLTDENKHSGHLNDHKTYYITVKINFQTVKKPEFIWKFTRYTKILS